MTDDERVQAIADANKIELFDENTALREDLAAIKDIAYRASGETAPAAIEAIFLRASRALAAGR